MGKVENILAKRNEIMKKSLGGIDYQSFEEGGISFDYEGLMNWVSYSLEEVIQIQQETKVGKTPLFELKNLTHLIRKISPPGMGARIFLKDEAANASGSFKDRRAALSVFQAKREGYKGVIAATSGNYGAAVASQALQRGLKCIIAQEVFDSEGRGQPEILEKGRKCEALGAEVWQLTVGPELFYWALILLDETNYFNASLYTPYGIKGIETLGYEIGLEIQEKYGKKPAAVLITHAGGGNVTGTARGLRASGCTDTKIIGASVDLRGLHMASDKDFNRKSFTTGHTGFGVPFAVNPDRVDVPRNAARPLRYLDRYLLVTQGEVFYATELLTRLEGIERGPAGNTSLAAAVALAREMNEEDILVVQETEYTGAGKHPTAQLTFAKQMGIEVKRGHPKENIPGTRIVIPEKLSQLSYEEYPLEKLKLSYLENVHKKYNFKKLSANEVRFLKTEIKDNKNFVEDFLNTKGVDYEQV